MQLFSWTSNLRAVCGLTNRPSRLRSRRSHRSRLPVAADVLEDRVLLATITVNSLEDNQNLDDFVTLREAIGMINMGMPFPDLTPAEQTQVDTGQAFGTNDTVQFDSSLVSNGPAAITTMGRFQLTNDFNIRGLGANQLTIDAGNLSQIFFVDGVINGSITVEISGLNLQRGRANGGTLDSNNGGAIFSNGANLTLSDVNISVSQADGVGGGLAAVNGTLTVDASNIALNTAATEGGGIFATAATGATNTVRNTTITNNTADSGGGIYNGGGAFSVINATIVQNGAGSTGGGIFTVASLANPATTTISNTIVAGNVGGTTQTSDDVANVSLGAGSVNNLIGDPNSAGGLQHGTQGNILGDGNGNILPLNQIVADPANNGGPTMTRRPVLGSPAINAGSNAAAIFVETNVPFPLDQRGLGFERIQGGTVDIGALESEVDLTTTVTDSDAFGVLGQSLLYTVTIANNAGPATGITVTATLGNNVEFDAFGSTSGWTETPADSGIFQFTPFNLDVGATRNLFFSVIPNSRPATGTTTTNLSVSAFSDATTGGDVNVNDNSSMDSTPLVTPLNTVQDSPFNAGAINGSYAVNVAGNFDNSSVGFPGFANDDIFFWNPLTGENRIVFGDGQILTNPIATGALNGNDFVQVVAGNFDEGGNDDLFFWNPVSGRNRLIHFNGNPGSVTSVIETNVVATGAINGNDFQQLVAGNFDAGNGEDLFFWNPVSGRNRIVHFDAVTPGTASQSINIQTNVVPTGAINGNDFNEIEIGEFVSPGLDSIFFVNYASGKNRVVSFSIDTFGSANSLGAVQTNLIQDIAINGNDFSELASGDFNQDGLDDIFFWNPTTGKNRMVVSDIFAMQPTLNRVFSDFVDRPALNGNDFSTLIPFNDANASNPVIGIDRLFFWNPITGKNRSVFTDQTIFG